jgi:hypothetical protein
MSNEIAVQDNGLPILEDDTLIHIAEQAERRIDAVIKIKQVALKVTNANDWVDQQGRPYLQASGSEKVANLFNISWRINEPIIDEEQDGTVTYTYKGEFTLAGRSIEVEGSRSSRDEFFKKYNYDSAGKRQGEKPLDRRDLKMAAMTNLLGNGITRLLGIRNLTYEDLERFAGIKKDQIKGVQYKDRKNGGSKPPVQQPQEKKADNGDARTKLKAEVEAYAGDDVDLMESVIRECSCFEKDGKEYSFGVANIFEQKQDGSMKVSDKWVGSALGKLREMVKGE